MNEYWQEVIQNFNRLIDGSPLKAAQLAHEGFHEISVCGDPAYAQEIARAWMEVLSEFGEVEDGNYRK